MALLLGALANAVGNREVGISSSIEVSGDSATDLTLGNLVSMTTMSMSARIASVLRTQSRSDHHGTMNMNMLMWARCLSFNNGVWLVADPIHVFEDVSLSANSG